MQLTKNISVYFFQYDIFELCERGMIGPFRNPSIRQTYDRLINPLKIRCFRTVASILSYIMFHNIQKRKLNTTKGDALQSYYRVDGSRWTPRYIDQRKRIQPTADWIYGSSKCSCAISICPVLNHAFSFHRRTQVNTV